MQVRRSVVQLEVPVDEAELAADRLWQAQPSAVSEAASDGARVRLVADVADPTVLTDLPATWTRIDLEVDDDGYLDAWRTWARPVRAGARTVLHPAWLPPAPGAPDDLVVVLDPGRAFGSGSHETTRLVVALLEELVVAGDRVLDVGCGSGVLSVVAVLLGASSAHGTDVAPEAVTATVANAAANGVGDRVRAGTEPLGEVSGTYELVVANIGGRVLFDLAAELVAHVAPGGTLVLAGVLEDQAAELVAACRPLSATARRSEAGWVAVALSRAAT